MIPFVFLSLTVPGFVLAVRALPPVERLVMEGVKPWACDICASFWGVVLWALLSTAKWGEEALWAAPPSYAAALWILSVLSRPRTEPPMPDLE